MRPNKAIGASMEAAERLFGEQPEDVISPIKGASDAFAWLHEIFTTIRNESQIPQNSLRIRTLAEAGRYIASEFSNYTGQAHETMLQRLQAAGAAPTLEIMGG
jgi:hypothetical protein